MVLDVCDDVVNFHPQTNMWLQLRFVATARRDGISDVEEFFNRLGTESFRGSRVIIQLILGVRPFAEQCNACFETKPNTFLPTIEKGFFADLSTAI